MGLRRGIRTGLCLAGMAAALLAGGVARADDGMAPATSITDMTIFAVKPEKAAAFMAVMRTNIAHSRKEDGNLRFDVFSHQSDKALNVYVLETWRDASSLKVHAQQATLLALHKTFADDLISHPQSSTVDTVTP